MLGTSLTMRKLIDSLSTPLMRQLDLLGLQYNKHDISALIESNLNFPLRFTPTVFSYYLYFRDHIRTISDVTQSPTIGHRVSFTDHTGFFHKEALIVAIIGSKVTISGISTPPKLSLMGMNKTHQKVIISTNPYNVSKVVDISNLRIKGAVDVLYSYTSNPVLEQTEVFIRAHMTCWAVE